MVEGVGWFWSPPPRTLEAGLDVDDLAREGRVLLLQVANVLLRVGQLRGDGEEGAVELGRRG